MLDPQQMPCSTRFKPLRRACFGLLIALAALAGRGHAEEGTDLAALLNVHGTSAGTAAPPSISQQPAGILRSMESVIVNSQAAEGIRPADALLETAIDVRQQTLVTRSPETLFHWKASNLRTRPLYFQDVSLERYGHQRCGYCGQTVRSGLKFYSDIIKLPLRMCADPPCQTVYALGYARPGDPTLPVRETHR